MSREETVEALVLDTFAYRDKDLIVRLFVRGEGALSAMAYGARKSRTKFPSGLDRLTLVEAQLARQGDRMPTCRSVVTRELHWNLRTDLDRGAVAAVLSEVLLKSHVDAQEAEHLFDFACSLLRELDSGALPATPEVALHLVMLLLQRLHFLPRKLVCEQCAPAATHSHYTLNVDGGSVRCRQHTRVREKGVPLSGVEVERLNALLAANTVTGGVAGGPRGAAQTFPLFERLEPYLANILGGPLKSLAFLRSLHPLR